MGCRGSLVRIQSPRPFTSPPLIQPLIPMSSRTSGCRTVSDPRSRFALVDDHALEGLVHHFRRLPWSTLARSQSPPAAPAPRPGFLSRPGASCEPRCRRGRIVNVGYSHTVSLGILRKLSLIVLGLTSALAVACAGVGGAGYGPATSVDLESQVQLEDLAGIDDLIARFNEDVGSPRLLLLMSPT